MNAQQQSSEDVKVGLVLSGGGAKGLAHIGALKIIDSLGVRIDYVAGTSMGSIIGSLYASGYSGKQIDSIFKKVNFDDV
ncbi:MAG: patatin-like phospholipase family protein, partial [Flavobacteriaceae bacterium]|nr:patatin-like phospholipase family protein [Flavobacteriaceae bacterium]